MRFKIAGAWTRMATIFGTFMVMKPNETIRLADMREMSLTGSQKKSQPKSKQKDVKKKQKPHDSRRRCQENEMSKDK